MSTAAGDRGKPLSWNMSPFQGQRRNRLYQSYVLHCHATWSKIVQSFFWILNTLPVGRRKRNALCPFFSRARQHIFLCLPTRFPFPSILSLYFLANAVPRSSVSRPAFERTPSCVRSCLVPRSPKSIGTGLLRRFAVAALHRDVASSRGKRNV